MKIYNYLLSISPSNVFEMLFRSSFHDRLPLLILIYMFIASSEITAKQKSIIFKGQPIKFEKSIRANGSAELRGKINGKNVIATTNNNMQNNGNYLGAFRKLDKHDQISGKKKLVTYHVFEIS